MTHGKSPFFDPGDKIIRERVSVLLTIAQIELIVCYGARCYKRVYWSLFASKSSNVNSIDLDILVVTPPSAKRSDHELVDRINQLNTQELRLVPIVHNSRALTEALSQGSRFFSCVLRRGILLFHEPLFHLPDLPTIFPQPARFRNGWLHRSNLAIQFLKGAGYHLASRHYLLAIFMMHQATEHICSAIINSSMGYRVTTHNLNRLLSLTETISPDISNVFLKKTDDEKALFSLLDHAYSQVRYDESFRVSQQQATELYNKVSELILLIRGMRENVVPAQEPRVRDFQS